MYRALSKCIAHGFQEIYPDVNDMEAVGNKRKAKNKQWYKAQKKASKSIPLYELDHAFSPDTIGGHKDKGTLRAKAAQTGT